MPSGVEIYNCGISRITEVELDLLLRECGALDDLYSSSQWWGSGLAWICRRNGTMSFNAVCLNLQKGKPRTPVDAELIY